MPAFSKQKYLELAKGFHRRRKNCYKIVIPVVHKKLQYAYIGRRLRRRDFRKQWI
jgi:large subunit ribosomal protein L20